MDELEVRVHGEITGYQEKFYGLTIRQWFAIILIVVINVPVYMIGLHNNVNDQFLKLLVVIGSIPQSLWGFVEIQGMKAETYVRYIFRHYGSFARALCYQSDVEYEEEKAKTKKQIKKEKKEAKKIEKRGTTKSRLERKQEKIQKKEAKAFQKEKLKKQKKEREQSRLLAKAKAHYGVQEKEEVLISQDDREDISITAEDIELLKKFRKLQELEKEETNK